jgi:hypothetical protein
VAGYPEGRRRAGIGTGCFRPALPAARLSRAGQNMGGSGGGSGRDGARPRVRQPGERAALRRLPGRIDRSLMTPGFRRRYLPDGRGILPWAQPGASSAALSCSAVTDWKTATVIPYQASAVFADTRRYTPLIRIRHKAMATSAPKMPTAQGAVRARIAPYESETRTSARSGTTGLRDTR